MSASFVIPAPQFVRKQFLFTNVNDLAAALTTKILICPVLNNFQFPVIAAASLITGNYGSPSASWFNFEMAGASLTGPDAPYSEQLFIFYPVSSVALNRVPLYFFGTSVIPAELPAYFNLIVYYYIQTSFI